MTGRKIIIQVKMLWLKIFQVKIIRLEKAAGSGLSYRERAVNG